MFLWWVLAIEVFSEAEAKFVCVSLSLSMCGRALCTWFESCWCCLRLYVVCIWVCVCVCVLSDLCVAGCVCVWPWPVYLVAGCWCLLYYLDRPLPLPPECILFLLSILSHILNLLCFFLLFLPLSLPGCPILTKNTRTRILHFASGKRHSTLTLPLPLPLPKKIN